MRAGPSILALAALLLSSNEVRAQRETIVDSLALARQYTQWLYEGTVDSLVAHSGERARQGFATAAGFRQYTDRISSLAGREVAVLVETWKLRNGDCQYWRVTAFSDFEDLLLVRWIINADGTIGGLGVGPNEQAPPIDAETCDAGGP